VVVGQRVGDDMVITRGLQPGETVVTEGQLRLEDGTAVEISDANGNVQGGGRGGRGGRGRGGQTAQGGQGAGGQRGPGQGGGQ
jgi:multidrug efflux system membrane fusion protein